MNILPKNISQFQEKEYWQQFFAQRQEGFEWYAEYEDLAPYFKQYVSFDSLIYQMPNKEGRILVVGCGNSLLSENLYDLGGYKNIVSIDYEEEVVSKMNERLTAAPRPGMSYVKMDMINMDYSNESEPSFDYVIDKGSLDALFSENNQETVDKVEKYLLGIQKVVKDKGAYLLITLFQDFIMDKYLNFIKLDHEKNSSLKNSIVDLEINTVPTNGRYQPFFVVAKRSAFDGASMPQMKDFQKAVETMSSFSDFQGDHKFKTFDELKEAIKNSQMSSMVFEKNKDLSAAQWSTISVYDKNHKSPTPKYTINVVDSEDGFILKDRKTGVCICPQGMERDPYFSTKDGNHLFSDKAKFARLIIVILNHGFSFTTLDDIKSELNSLILSLAPPRCSNIREIPYMTIGQSIGEKSIVSSSNGIIVEDFKEIDGDVFRQIVFQEQIDIIQGESRIVLVSKDELAQNPYLGNLGTNLIPRSASQKKSKTFSLDTNLLTQPYQILMLGGVLHSTTLPTAEKFNVLSLGFGVGVLESYLIKNLPSVHIEGIEQGQNVIEVAQRDFGIQQGERLVIQNAKAQDFVSKAEESKKFYDVILIDMPENQPTEGKKLTNPSEDTFTEAFVKGLKNLTSESSIVILNFMTEDAFKIGSYLQPIFAPHFPHIKAAKVEDRNNFVFIMSQQELKSRQSVGKGEIQKDKWSEHMDIEKHLTLFKPMSEVLEQEEAKKAVFQVNPSGEEKKGGASQQKKKRKK